MIEKIANNCKLNFYFKLTLIALIIYYFKNLGNATDLNKFRSIFSLSENWDDEYWMKWHQQNWLICIPLSIFYVLSVYYGVQFMKNRKPFTLRYFLGIWSAVLGIFSILGSYYFLPEILSKLYNDGLHKAACDNTYKSDKTYMFWAWLFTWSKIFEFGDTLFIILRKQKLTFLHWYHHAMTVICVFSFFPFNNSINRWTGSMNYFIHSIMYTYYSFKAFRIFIPRFIAFFITISQIAQMFIGLFIAAYIFVQKQTNTPCEMTKYQSYFAISIYLSYFVLFCNFFIQTYFMKKSSLKSDSCSKIKANGKSTDLHLDENGNLSKQKVN